MARAVVNRYGWTDVQPSRNFREAFLVHTSRLRETAKGYVQLLGSFTEAVRENLAQGILIREDFQYLETLRDILQIQQEDYERLLVTLMEEAKARAGKLRSQLSPEKRLQLESYAEVLKLYLEEVFAVGGTPNKAVVMKLRDDFQVSTEEHAAIIEEVARKFAEQKGGAFLLSNWSF